jgi:two-component system chemotaxis response regulator CheB
MPLRVLVVDDSVFNRRSIGEILAQSPEIEVVGKAADGEEALRLVSNLKPDAITLDLEMPRMDGFTFLRILMTKMPTPVVVVSSYSQKENVFKALELGALDFVAKPERFSDPDLGGIREQLVSKVLLARSVKLGTPPPPRRAPDLAPAPVEAKRDKAAAPPKSVIAVASSTGGPSALMEIFTRFPNNYRNAVVIAQHMPDKFTRTFAERLSRRGALKVNEAQDQDSVSEGTAFVCPGRHCMELEVNQQRGSMKLKVMQPSERDRYVPSADRLLTSVALGMGRRAVGVILTGMGDDGVEGARRILEAGGIVIAESEESAVVYGMPGAAVRAGVATRSLPLGEIAELLAKL